MRPRYSAAVLASLCVLAVAFPIAVGAQETTEQSSYELAVDGDIETPDRTVTIEGNDYRLDAVGAVKAGESFRVDVTVPSDRVYDVELRNADEQVVDRRRILESTSVSFDSGALKLDPGTYALTIIKDQEVTAVHPVVVSGYELNVDLPSSVQPGESAVATIEVSYTELNTPPEGIEVVAFRGDAVQRVSAATITDRQYEATLSFAEDAPTGEYSVYAVAKGAEKLSDDYPVSLAIDNGIVLQVTAQDSGSGGETGGGTSGGTGQNEPIGDDDEDADSTPSASENETSSVVGNKSSSENGNETSDESAVNETDGTDDSRGNEKREERNDSNSVISPTNQTDGRAGAESQPTSPALVLAAIAVLLFAVALRDSLE